MTVNSRLTPSIFLPQIFLLLGLCMVWPTGGLLFAVLYVNQKINICRSDIVLFIVAISFYLAFINSTKLASSDTVHYLNWYNAIDRLQPLNSFFFYRGSYSITEPLFAVISIVINYVTMGSETAYLFICTVIIYFMQFYAIYMVAEKFRVRSRYTIYIILMLAFANPLFIQSVHALRQMLATSFLMLAIAYRVVQGKNNWYLIVASFLTHMSVIAYLPIVVINTSYKSLTIKRVVSIGILVIVSILIYQNIGAMLESSSFELVSAAGDKMINSSNNNEMELSLRGFYIYNIPFLLIALISLFKMRKKYSGVNVYYYLYFITFFIVVLNPISTEVSVRYAFYIFSFFPYLFIDFYLTKRNFAVVISMTAVLFTSIFFVLLARDSNYADIFTILFGIMPFFT